MAVLSQESQTLAPLPLVLSQGLVAVSTFGFLSFFFSTSLFFFLTYRLLSWRRKAGSQPAANQFLVLIYNLVLADIQQSIAFLLNVSSLRHDALQVGTRTCWAQGWFVSTGDLASSVFIFAIAVHTFLGVVKGYRLRTFQFYSAIAACWLFVYGMAIIGAAMHPDDLYVRAGAWCWINASYQAERLWLHYFWIFVACFSTSIIYGIIYVTLRRRSANSSTPIPHGATPLMILYPAIYTICTIPLAAGRIASMAGQNVSLAYFCVAGSMIACNGWLDALLYSLTRRSIIFSEVAGDNIGIQTFWALEKAPRLGNVTTVEVGCRRSGSVGGSASLASKPTGHTRGGGALSSSASTEHLYGLSMGGIKVQATVDVRTEEVNVDDDAFEMRRQECRKTDSRERVLSSGDTKGASWDERSLDDL